MSKHNITSWKNTLTTLLMCMNSTQHTQTTAEENMKKHGLFVHMRGNVEIPSRK